MNYIAVVVTWLLTGGLIGFIGAMLGPGAALLICGMILGVVGSIIHTVKIYLKLDFNLVLLSLIVALVATIVTILIALGSKFELNMIITVAVFYTLSALLASGFVQLLKLVTRWGEESR